MAYKFVFNPITSNFDMVNASGGSGTVTSVSVSTANGVSGSVANATTTPAISLTLGAITPTSVNGATITTTTGTLTLVNGSTLVTAGAFSTTLTATGATNVTLPTTGTLATLAGVETLTNKRVTPLVVAMADATSFTPTGDAGDFFSQANTQALGTLTANAPTGTPTNGQKIIIRIRSTNVQTFSWNAIYRGSTTLALPATSTGATKTDYFGFIYNTVSSTWDYVSAAYGY